MSLYRYTKEQLILIETELKTLQLWSKTAPSPAAMADPTPFACESMAFEQWLQFIFIPKMHDIIAQRGPLPNKIALGPMAEHLWQDSAKMDNLINIINQLDEQLSGSK